MIINADLHIHSRFSGATSKKMSIQNLAFIGPLKGIDVFGTGDCLHSGWMKEIKTCEVVDEGTFQKDKTLSLIHI